MIFVYGTLRSEFGNQYSRLLRSQAELVGPAIVAGSIFRVGNYPGYRPEPAGEVHGELYRLNDPEPMLKTLDDYEGEEYERIVVEALGRETWIYRYKPDPPEDSRIASGDFCAQ